jgi:hypothetical protein
MVTPYDSSINVKAEVTYGTYVAPTRAYEYTDEGFDWKPTRKQGEGLRVSSRVARSGRRVTTTVQGEGSLEVEATTKGLSTLLDAALGTSTATLVSGTTYQHNFTLGDAPASLTIQKSVPDSTATVRAHSFLGCMVSSWSLAVDNDDIVKLSFDFDIRDLDTAQTFAALTYPTTPSLYHFGQGAATYSGTVTVPTTTAIGTGGTAATDIRDFKLDVNNNLATDRFNLGAAGKKAKPTVGIRDITGSFTAEYSANGYRDDFIADTERAIVVTCTSTEALSVGFATLQVVLPAVKLDSGIPISNNGDFITVEHQFTVLDNLVAAQPIYVVLRTADSTVA